MKDLFFFSFSYPYSHDFSWKRNEIHELKKHFNISVIPYVNQKPVPLENIPEGINVNNPVLKEPVIGTRSQLYKTIFSPRVFYYYREYFRKKLYRNKAWTLEWISSVARTEKLFKNPSTKRFLKYNKENGNSILYFYWGVGSTLLIPFLKKYGYKKIVVRFHGFDLYEDRRTGYIPFRTELLKNIDHAIFISDHGGKYMHATYPNIKFNSRVFRLGSRKNGTSSQSEDAVLRIVSCSNVIALKRVHLIAEALKNIDFNIEWTHLGDGEQFDQLKELIKTLPANIKVNLPGRKSPSEVLDFYGENNVDLFLNVSTTEGVPVSIMEAFSAGIPVYATSVGGTPEIVNESNGKLLEKDLTAAILADEINAFHNLDKEKRDNFRKAALETYKNKCDFEKLNNQFVEFLMEESEG